MNYNEILEKIYREAINNKIYTKELSEDETKWIDIISKKCFNQKGVFAVLVTLLVPKKVKTSVLQTDRFIICC